MQQNLKMKMKRFQELLLILICFTSAVVLWCMYTPHSLTVGTGFSSSMSYTQQKQQGNSSSPVAMNPSVLPSDKSQSEKPQPQKSQSDKSLPEKAQREKTQPEKTKPEKLQPEKSQREKPQPETSQPETSQPEKPQPGTFRPLQVLASTLSSQYVRFKRFYPEFKLWAFPKWGKHNQMAIAAQRRVWKYSIERWTESRVILARVTERYKGEISEGGSYIHGTVTSDSGVLDMCAYEDFFNGTYLVQCPLYSNCAHANVLLQQVEYRHFQHIFEELNVPLINDTFCAKIKGNVLPKPKRFWQNHDKSSWTWTSNDTAGVSNTVKNYCQAANSFDRLYMMGASHMRYQYAHLLRMCESSSKTLRKRVIYIDGGFGSNLKSFLQDIATGYTQKTCHDGALGFMSNILNEDDLRTVLKSPPLPNGSKYQVFSYKSEFYSQPLEFCKPSNNSKVGIMVQTGSFDLCVNGLNMTLNIILQLDTALKNLSQALGDSHPSVQFLVMSAPPFNPSGFTQGRVTSELLLLNDALERSTAKYGLHYYPYFGMLLPRYKENVGSHFMHCYYKSKWHCRGELGKMVARHALLTLAAQGDH